MKASFIRGFGGPEVLQYGDVDTPAPSTGDVRVKVLACGINHYDIFLRRGEVNARLPMPHVMGADIVGDIDALGPEVTGFELGQRVVIAPGFPQAVSDHEFEPLNLARSYVVTGGLSWGGYAEYAVAPARFVSPDITDLPPEELATLPLVMTTAVHAVRTLGGVQPGHKVLVQAGASGSGALSIQVAKALGAEVATTVGGPEKFDFVRGIGADRVIDYNRESFPDAIKEWTAGQGVDVVVDNVGGSVFEGNIRALRRGGHFVNFGMVGGATAPYQFPLVFYKQIHLHGSMMGTPDELVWGFEEVRAGRIRPILDRTIPLRDAAEAHRRIEARQVRGKIVLLP